MTSLFIFNNLGCTKAVSMLNWQLQLFPQRNEARFIVYIATDLLLTFEVDRDVNISEYQSKNKTLSACSYYVMYAFLNESTFYSYLNFREPVAPNRSDIWKLSDYNGNRTRNHLVRKQTLNLLAKLTFLASLAKWLSVRLRTKSLRVPIPLQPLKNFICNKMNILKI